MGVKSVAFAMLMKQLNIYFLIVTMLNKYVITGLSLSKYVSHMFENWLHILDDNMKKITMAGVAALCWAIWRCRNDIIFNKIKYSSFMQTIFNGIYWLCF
jgi:hypothetical protein